MFRPCFLTHDAFENAYKKSDLWVDSNFSFEYRKHIAALDHIGNCAKIFIINNYEKVTVWSNLDVTIKDNSGKTTEYYKFVPGDRTAWGESVQTYFHEMEARQKKHENPIVSFNDVVLDPTDGDFSVTINGKDHLWLENCSIIQIASYIEEFIKEKH